MRKFSLIIIAAVLAMLVLTGCVPAEAPPAADPTAQQALNIANTNTGSIQALAARVGVVEGRTAGEVTQAELDTLAGQVAALSAKVTELEDTVASFDSSGSTSPDGTIVATETRWRPSIDVSTGWDNETLTDDQKGLLSIGISKIDPFPIREADVYSLEVVIENKGDKNDPEPNPELTENVTLEPDLVLAIVLVPSDQVKVSKDVDVYQVGQPYGIWWYTTVTDQPTTGICRRIRAESDEFSVKVKPGEVITIKLEFELIYA